MRFRVSLGIEKIVVFLYKNEFLKREERCDVDKNLGFKNIRYL